MADDVIPDDVRRFVLRYIDTVAQLEALLMLQVDVQAEWDVTSVAQRLYIGEEETAVLLAGLAAHGFLADRDGMYSYRPQTPELERMVERLADTYRRYLVPVTHLIHSKSKNRVRKFADAFRIRKD